MYKLTIESPTHEGLVAKIKEFLGHVPVETLPTFKENNASHETTTEVAAKVESSGKKSSKGKPAKDTISIDSSSGTGATAWVNIPPGAVTVMTPLDKSNAARAANTINDIHNDSTETVESTTDAPVYEDVKKATLALIRVKSKKDAVAVFNKFGCQDAFGLPVEKFAEAIKALNEAAKAA